METIERLDRSPVVFFYGGEPLPNPRMIMEVVDLLPGPGSGSRPMACSTAGCRTGAGPGSAGCC
ncbi:hypothetical protein CF15_07355 [Pyrodictium occultum]|uniref:Uncharacterized protein n=1 Tax=Pyrodictium occultum TaxID=2309 RepID=A0A0V8RWU5_PYROC|nr:hypothetical protein CF15_07355 [Pyrodictium occultum]